MPLHSRIHPSILYLLRCVTRQKRTTIDGYCFGMESSCAYGGGPDWAAATETLPCLVPFVGGVGALVGQVVGLATVVAPATTTTTSDITAAATVATLVVVLGHVALLAALVIGTAATTSSVGAAATSTDVAAATTTAASTEMGAANECAVAGHGDVDGPGAAVAAGANDILYIFIFAALVRADEAEPLCVVKPLDVALHPLR
jgi:hypothetical protein